MSDKSTSLDIQSFIIFDPTLTNNENEGERKILYCYPQTISNTQQLVAIGLCEAMCNFAREFTNSPCQYIHTMKTRIVLHRLEDNIWMVLTLHIPRNMGIISLTTSAYVNHKRTELDEYADEEIQNSICESIINHCRQMFFLFMGPPSLIIKNAGIESLKLKLDKFFDRYIGHGMLDSYHITDGLTGVQFLTVDEDVFLNVVNLITNLKLRFPSIFCSMLLVNNYIVYSTVDKEDLGILYRYLTTTLLAKYNVNETMNSIFTTSNMGRFVFQESTSGQQTSNLPKIFFRTNEYIRGNRSSITECYVLVYKAIQATVVIFVDQSVNINDALYSAIHDYLGPEITVLVKAIIQKNCRFSNTATDNGYKYMYWNRENLSLKSTLFPVRQFKSDFAPLVPLDSMRIMSDIKEELDRDNRVREMGVKLSSDSWVSSVKNKEQELLVSINKRNLSMVDVSKEMKLVCKGEFPNIFKVDCD